MRANGSVGKGVFSQRIVEASRPTVVALPHNEVELPQQRGLAHPQVGERYSIVSGVYPIVFRRHPNGAGLGDNRCSRSNIAAGRFSLE